MSKNAINNKGSSDIERRLNDGIDATRSRMDHAVEELGSKLDPHHTVDNLRDWLGNTSLNDTVRTLKETAGSAAGHMSRHPVPYTLAGAGLAWLAVEAVRSHGRSVPQRTADHVDDGIAAAKNMAHSVKGAATHFAESTADMAVGATESLNTGVHRAIDDGKAAAAKAKARLTERTNAASETARDNPMAVGGGLLALGLLAGLLIPRTRTEHTIMGGASDEVLEDVRDAGREVINRGKEAVQSVIGQS